MRAETQAPTDHANYVMGRQDYVLYAVTILTWGSSWFAMHLQLGLVAPEVSLFWRFSGAAVLMIALAFFRHQSLRFPWRVHQTYLRDLGVTRFSRLTDPALKFGRARKRDAA